jgi:hypothetical protein
MAAQRGRGGLLSAAQLNRVAPHAAVLDGIATDTLNTINDQCIDAAQNCIYSISFMLPTNLGATGISNKRAMSIVYFKIIKSLEDRDYKVNLAHDPDAQTWTLGIEWSKPGEAGGPDHMLDYVLSHLKKE